MGSRMQPGGHDSTILMAQSAADPAQAPRGSTRTIVPAFDGPTPDDDASRRTAARALRIGLWVWPSFGLLDAYMCFVAYPGAPFGLFVGYRVLVELVFLSVYRSTRRPAVRVPRLYWEMNVSFGIAALAIALMAVHLDGVRSPYMHGISIIALVRAALVPTHWRRALPTFIRIGLAFPLVMGAGAVLSPLARAEWLNAGALTVFASNYVFVVASAFLGLVSGHLVWRTQQQLYRARRVGRYRLQAPIGQGGMGEVWLAWDLTLRRNVALKLLRIEGARGASFVKRFEREAQATSQLRGQHIVQIFDFGASDDGLYYLAMEYLTGMDLRFLVERFGPVPAARAVNFIKQACLALEEAHGAGIIHRDIKPHNLFVTRVGNDPDYIKLLDFGVVRLRVSDPGTESLTLPGLLVGTPAYLAPELWGGGEADERSDIYALGITLHYLLTGCMPQGKSRAALEEPGETAAVVELAPVLGGPDAEQVAAVVRQCVALRPDDRFQTARHLYDALAGVPLPTPWTHADAEAFWEAADRTRFR